MSEDVVVDSVHSNSNNNSSSATGVVVGDANNRLVRMMPLDRIDETPPTAGGQIRTESGESWFVDDADRTNNAIRNNNNKRNEEEQAESPSGATRDETMKRSESTGEGSTSAHTLEFAVTVHDASTKDITNAPTSETTKTTASSTSVDTRSDQQDVASSNQQGNEGKRKASSKSIKQQQQQQQQQTETLDNDKRKRPRRKANVIDSNAVESQPRGLPLPSNQYETILIRRAIRKVEDAPSPLNTTNGGSNFDERQQAASEEKSDNNKNRNSNKKRKKKKSTEHGGGVVLEEYGDISLGMKLNVIGGKVIVQRLNALADGRASPAQLAGLIHRGDVLLSINDSSLVNLPIDQLMNGLSPLSTPDSTGAYKRKLKLRFAAGDGLDLLRKSEPSGPSTTSTTTAASAASTTTGQAGKTRSLLDPAADVFALFPMVDQFSGMPLFEDLQQQQLVEQEVSSPTKSDQSMSSSTNKADRSSAGKDGTAESVENRGFMLQKEKSINHKISESLAVTIANERSRFQSDYFASNEKYALLMQPTASEGASRRTEKIHSSPSSPAHADENLALANLIERGRRATMGAVALSDHVETVDSGKQAKPVQSWSTTLSLYSRSSARRRPVFDTDSLPVNIGRVEEEVESEAAQPDDDDNDDDEQSDLDGEEMEGEDEALLRLVATDEEWRKQVIDFLLDVAKEEETSKTRQPAIPSSSKQMKASALSSELGSFLFGDNVTKLLDKQKKLQALPPQEVTAAFFDLANHLAPVIPDEIKELGGLNQRSGLIVPVNFTKRLKPRGDVALATQFLLEEALPSWLKAFRPLSWEQRRLLWPLDRISSAGGSTVSSTRSDNDSLSVDSYRSAGSKQQRKRKSLREKVEEQELNPETRKETCFLVTFYFLHVLLPKLVTKKTDAKTKETNKAAMDEILAYIKDYGAYLRLHTCISYAAVLKSEEVIDTLLEVAKFDPRHRESMRQISKGNSLLFYEPAMLSAVVLRLNIINFEQSIDRKLAIIGLCSSAFPDLRPWQVAKHCHSPRNDTSNPRLLLDDSNNVDLYYTYLSQLLHPTDGHEAARRDIELVREWCELSIQETGDSDIDKRERRRNFYSVASRTSSDHRAYARDLRHLLTLCMEITDYMVALDIVGEQLENPESIQKDDDRETILKTLHTIGRHALLLREGSRDAKKLLRRVVTLFRTGANHSKSGGGRAINVANEITKMVEFRASGQSSPGPAVYELVRFLAEESVPTDLLESLTHWSESFNMDADLYSILRSLLKRGSEVSIRSELSVSLLRIKHARPQLTDTTVSESENSSVTRIWKRLSSGSVPLEK